MRYVSRVLNMHGYLKSAAFAASMLVLTACGGQPTEDVLTQPTVEVTITPASPSVAVNGTINFVGTNGTPPYVFGIVSGAGSISSSSGAFTAPGAAGSVVVGFVDQAGKTATTTVTVVGPVNIVPSVTSVLAGNTRSFSGSGGQTPYTYAVVSGGGTINSAGLYTAPASSGSATVRITDALGQTANAAVTIDPALTIAPASISIAVNATQQFTAAGGLGGYTFSVVSGGGSIDPSTGLYTAPASASTVVVRVTDSGANTANATVNVVGPLSIAPGSWTLAAGNTRAFTGVGGQGPYVYSVFSGGGSINSATGTYTAPMSDGVAVVRVSDAFGQTADANVTINPALAIDPVSVTLEPSDTQTFTGSGGVGAYVFSVVSGGGSINPSTGLYTAPAPGGGSAAVVRVTDTLGNTANANITIQLGLSINPTTFTLAVNNTRTFSAAGGQAPYTFSVFSGGGSINPSTGLYTAPASAGSAVVRVTDNMSNTADATVTINAALSISPAAVNILTNGAQTFTASGGVTPYTYSVVSGGGSINSSSGAYTAPASPATVVVRVTDAIGNTANANATVVHPLVISPSPVTLAVNNSTTFSASGGQTPYVYSILSGGGSINSSSGAFTAPGASGTTVVRVTDNLGSTSDSTVTVNPAIAISPASVTLALNAMQTFTATGGVSPYTYSVISGGGSIGSSSGDYTAPATPSTVTVRVTDSLSNWSEATVTVNDPLTITPPTFTLAVNNQRTFVAGGGVSPYTFSILSGTGSVDPATGVYTAPASSGSAVVRVTDNIGNTADASVTINPALAISPVSAIIPLSSTQAFSSSGGVAPHTFSLVSGGGSVNPSTGLYTAPGSPGAATVRVTDALGNTADAAITISNTLSISPSSWTLAVNNTRTFAGVGGQAPFTYSKVSGVGTINSSSGLYTAPASSGSAVVRVTDNLGQTADATITVNPALAISPATYTMAVNALHTFSATGGVTPYTYSVFSGGGSINSSSGAFTAPATAQAVVVRVTDSLGNTSDSGVTIVDALTITPSAINMLVNDLETFVAGGGVAPYVFSVVSGGGSVDSASGDYTAPNAPATVVVRVTDNIGLTANATIQVYEPLVIAPTAVTLAPDNVQQFSTTGGLGAVTFSIFSGDGSVDPNTGDYTAGSSAGAAVVRATDSIGNTSDAAVTINGALTISPATKKISINETFTFTAANGVPPRTFSVESGGGSIDPATGVYTAPGTSQAVTVRVTDSLDNISESTVTIITPVKLWSGGYNNCVRYDDNSVKCWGDGANGKLGSGATVDWGDASTEMGSNLAFLDLGAGRYPKEMALGDNHSCAILDNDTLKCWGLNSSGQLGLGNTTSRGSGANQMSDNLPVVDLGAGRTVKKVAVGPTNTCAILDNDALKCWGLNTYGQLGYQNVVTLGDGAGEMGDVLAAVNLGTSRYAVDVKIGLSHTCALLDDATVKCWGRNNRGQLGKQNTITLGDGANEMGNNLTAIALGTGRTALQIATGTEHVCAKLDDNSTKCWGRANAGQLGQGSTLNRGDGAGEMGNGLAVTALGASISTSSIYASFQHGCAIMSNGALKCWGLNTYGELGKNSVATLGDGGGEMGDNLTAIDTNSTVSQFAIGLYHMCVLTSTAEVKCWGRATQGALGNGTTTGHRGDAANEMGVNLPRVNL